MDKQKILAELDTLFREGKLAEAEMNMNAWLTQGIQRKDHALCLMMYNELTGLYRSTSRIPQAVEASDKALSLIPVMRIEKTPEHATTLLNAATARRMAGDKETALGQFLEAENILQALGQTDTYEMAGLKNNLSQLYQDLSQHEKALSNLDGALKIVQALGANESDVATTRINKAISLMALDRLQDAETEIQEAMRYYSSETGLNSPHRAAALSASAELAVKRGDFNKAEELYVEAMNMTKDKFGENYAYEVLSKNLADVRQKL